MVARSSLIPVLRRIFGSRCAVLGLVVFVVFLLGSKLTIHNPAIEYSSFQCVEARSSIDTSCIFRNVIVFKNRVLYVERPQSWLNTTLPRPLTGVSSFEFHEPLERSALSVEAVSRQYATEMRYLASARRIVLQTAIIWRRLNSNNFYHTLFEDLIPAYRTICRLFGEDSSSCAKSDAYDLPTIIFNDHAGHWDPFGLFQTLWPKWTSFHDMEHSWVEIRELAVGSRSTCLHPIHCRGRWLPGEIISFRKLAMQTLGVVENTLAPKSQPRIVVVNRPAGPRSIENLPDLMHQISKFYPLIKVVDVASESLEEQARIYHEADIVIAVHGAAMGNMLYARPNAVFLDLQPTNFTGSHRIGLDPDPHLTEIIGRELCFGGINVSVEIVEIPIEFYSAASAFGPHRIVHSPSLCETEKLLKTFSETNACEGCFDCVYHWVFLSSSFTFSRDFLVGTIERALLLWRLKNTEVSNDRNDRN